MKSKIENQKERKKKIKKSKEEKKKSQKRNCFAFSLFLFRSLGYKEDIHVKLRESKPEPYSVILIRLTRTW